MKTPIKKKINTDLSGTAKGAFPLSLCQPLEGYTQLHIHNCIYTITHTQFKLSHFTQENSHFTQEKTYFTQENSHFTQIAKPENPHKIRLFWTSKNPNRLSIDNQLIINHAKPPMPDGGGLL